MASPSLEVIDEATFGVKIDIKYATADNFTGHPVYSRPACALHKDAADHLRKAIGLAKEKGYILKIFDTYRPPETQWIFWDFRADPEFLKDPRLGSPHSRAVAVDLTLCTPDGKPLDMGTEFDEFNEKSHHASTDIPVAAQENRKILRQIMMEAGWDDYRNEWWHYQLFNAKDNYPIITHAESGLDMMTHVNIHRANEIADRWGSPVAGMESKAGYTL